MTWITQMKLNATLSGQFLHLFNSFIIIIIFLKVVNGEST